MWRHWMSVGAVVVGALAGWTQATIMPVERRVDVKAKLITGPVDDPAEVALGSAYGTHTAKAEIRRQETYLMFPVEVFCTTTVTSVVQPDMLKIDIQSSHSHQSVTPYYGLGEGLADITFDVTEPTKFRVSWSYEGMFDGSFWIPCLVQGQPSGVLKVITYSLHPQPETDAIYECGPGRYTLRVTERDVNMAGVSGEGHLSIVMQAVPEPGIAGMLLMAAVGMMARRRR
ncbi:MAG: PEP-CTERM sorting domain-containing protein [Bacillota bacterium]